MLTNIHIVINPTAGADEPILSLIANTFKDSGIAWDVSVTKDSGDAFKFAAAAIDKKFDAVGVYGGDGTVAEVAEALFGHATPMAIIPGGTANVLAKELLIPPDTNKALEMITTGSFLLKQIDMARANDKLFILRINAGFVADMITDTDRELKDKIGQLAYGVTAVKHIAQAEPVEYVLRIDGEEVRSTGVALVIANSGNLGFTGISYVPDILVGDGLLDVIVIKRADVASIVALAGSTLLQTKPEKEIDQWKGKKVSVVIPESQSVMIDDSAIEARDLQIEILPQALTVLVPNA